MAEDVDNWCVYILECSDGTLYTGITNNLEKRLKAHNAGKGAKYTRGRGPVTLVCVKIQLTKSEALKLECRIKKQPKAKKVAFLKNLGGRDMTGTGCYNTNLLMVWSLKCSDCGQMYYSLIGTSLKNCPHCGSSRRTGMRGPSVPRGYLPVYEGDYL